MTTLLILYHSLTGGSEAMARAALLGAQQEAGVTPRLLTAAEATAEDLIAADGAIFACPENLASMAGVMKDFFDRAYYPALGKIEGRPYATMICAGSDGEGAARQIARIATGWRMKAVAEPPYPLHPCPNAGGHSRFQDPPGGSACPLPGPRSGHGSGACNRCLLRRAP